MQSEKNFYKLYSHALTFLETDNKKIVDTNFASDIFSAIGSLDETAVEVVKLGEIKDKYSAASAINAELRDKSRKDISNLTFISMATTFGSIIGTIFLLCRFSVRFKNSPKRLKLKLGRRRLPTDC